MKIGILVGSLRKGSFNKKLAEISKNIINEGNQAEIIDISFLSITKMTMGKIQ